MNEDPDTAPVDPVGDLVYEEKIGAIYERVDEACTLAGHKRVRVQYSAYKTDENDDPIDNLDEVAIHGKVILYAPATRFFGGEESRRYFSKPVENPTWLTLSVLFNESIRRTRDQHHCFLEGVRDTFKERNGVPVYQFVVGS